MATRFYTSIFTATPSITPAFDAGWEQTGSAARFMMWPKQSGRFIKSATTSTLRNVPITTTQDILTHQFISEGLPRNMVIEGTVEFRHYCVESATTANVTLAVVLKVVSSDGGTVRGTLFSNFNNAAEFASPAAARGIAATAITTVSCLAGDRLVYEIGGHATGPTAATTFQISLTTGFTDAAGAFSDLTTTTTTTQNNGYFELSTNIWNDDFNNFRSPTSDGGLSVTG